jgi:hypothetical protein
MIATLDEDDNAHPSARLPSPHERRQLSVATLGIDDRTIIRAYLRPDRVRESTRLRLAEAIRKLGLPPLPDLLRSDAR